MSVPTKTGQDIWKDIEAYELKYHTLSNLRKQKWVLLEDHQKEIELAVKKGFDLVEAYEKQIKREGWLSPEQKNALKEKLKTFFMEEICDVQDEDSMFEHEKESLKMIDKFFSGDMNG